MKKFISVLLSLAMIFSAFGAVNANASNLQNMYYAYKYLIDSACVENRKVSSYIDGHYDLYDIDKDGSAELFIFSYKGEDYSSVSVYTYKNGQVYLCSKLSANDQFAYNTMCENEYGNGVGITGGTGAGWRYQFYVLNGTELTPTGNYYECYIDFYPDDSPVFTYNGNKISENTALTYFARRIGYGKFVNDLTYLKKYFNM